MLLCRIIRNESIIQPLSSIHSLILTLTLVTHSPLCSYHLLLILFFHIILSMEWLLNHLRLLFGSCLTFNLNSFLYHVLYFLPCLVSVFSCASILFLASHLSAFWLLTVPCIFVAKKLLEKKSSSFSLPKCGLLGYRY